MPEAVIDAPVSTPAADAGSQQTNVPAGIDAAMKAFEEVSTPRPAADKPDAKPDAKPTDAPPADKAKPQADADKAPAADKKVTDKAKDIWEQNPQLKGEHFKTVREMQTKIDGYEKRIKEIESKKVETPADNKLVEQYQTRIKEMEKRLAATDFRQSEDFQKQFVSKWQNEYKAAVAEVSQLQITITDAEGNQKQRPATEADFQKIMRMPAGEQDQLISDLFGNKGTRVFSRIMRLQDIERSSEEAIREHSEQAETSAKEKQIASERATAEYQRHLEAASEHLTKGWPQYFAPDEKDPQSTEALETGMKFVDDALANAQHLPPDERAALNAVVRARAGAMPRLVYLLNKANARAEAAEAEVSKFRKGDPGADGTSAGGATAAIGDDDIPAGIDAATKAFKI